MRCGCAECGGFMVNSEGKNMGCVCPVCGYRCIACLGTNSVIGRDELKSLKNLADAGFVQDWAPDPDED